MVRALWPSDNVKRLERSVRCLIPFKPFFVSTGYALAMQAEFIRLGLKHRSLHPSLRGHVAAATSGALAFASEEILADRVGFKHMHSLWHLFSAYGLMTVGSLISHKEKVRALQAARNMHDSAASLPDLCYNSVDKVL